MPPPPKHYWFHISYWVYIIPVAYSIYFALMMAPLSGVFRPVVKTGLDRCNKVAGFEGFKNCEDFVLSDEPGVAYVGCDPIRTKVNTVMNFNSLAPGEIAPSGAIWKVRYTENPPVVEKLTVENGELKLSSDYHPLGVAFDVNPSTGQRTLLTVNLAHKSGPSIEVFDVKDTKLVYKKPISHPEIYSPNSVHVISDSRLRADDGTPSFFFSNDHYFSSGILKMIENYFFYLSNVKFYNARTGEVQKAVDGLLFANGVSGTDDTLFVAEVHKMDIKQYKINVKTTPKLHVSLDFIKEKKFEMGVDNVAYNPKTNQVIVAGHPKSLQTVIYISTANKEGVAMPPSQVAAWDLDSNQVKILFEDDGSYFGSSTAGAIDAVNSKLLASGLYEEGLLVCDL